MDLVSALPAFLLAVLAISAVPGPAIALILRRAAVHGGRATVPLVLGLETGLFAWAMAAARGLAALVAVSEVAYAVLRVAGTVVLVVLGLLAWRAAWRARRSGATAEPLPEVATESARHRLPARRAYLEGVVTNLANPKAAVFMVAFFPQFIPHGYPVLASTVFLATVQVMVEAALYCALAFGVARLRGALGRPQIRSAIEAVSGTVLLGLGAKIATTARAVS